MLGTSETDTLWLLVCAGLVFLMQAGFTALEAGYTRTKNSINVAAKNLTDAGVSLLVFWLWGFALMFGTSAGGSIGTDRFAPDLSADAPMGAFLLFQAMFAATVTTILSGAVAERMRYWSFVVLALLTTGLLYPVFGHWAWGGIERGAADGFLAARGFYDFAGSTVVHSIGGWAALAAVLVMGPRIGRFRDDGTPREFSGSNLAFTVVGALLLWMGWFGFNGGSELGFTDRVPGVLFHTALGGAAGLAAAAGASALAEGHVRVMHLANGSLAGLVAVTASANVVATPAALAIGAGGGLAMFAVNRLLLRLRIDDAVGAVPVHLGAGVWGTVAVALFADPAELGTGLGRLEQLGAQLLGVAVAAAWAFGAGLTILLAVNRFFPLRVSPEGEEVGLNVSEHRARSDLRDLVDVMERQGETGDLSLRAPAEPFTEVGTIATHYNHMMARLEEEVGRATAVVTATHTPILTTDGALRVQTTNPATSNVLGVDATSLQGRPASAMFQGTDEVERFLRAHLANGGAPRSMEATVLTDGGEEVPVHVTASPFRSGAQAGLVTVLHDVRPIREAEEARRALLQERTEALERITQVRTQLLNAVAHELSTPLTPIRIQLSLLRQEALEAPTVSPDQVQTLDVLDRNFHRLTRLVQDVLDVVRLQADALRIRRDPMDLAPLLQEATDTYRPLCGEKGVDLTCEAEKGLQVEGDADRVMQVLYNVLSNAWKFTPEGGSIRLRARREDDDVRVDVQDSGIGMTDDQRARVFEEFMQVHDTHVVSEGGTGLGLFIARGIVERHGGTVEVASDGPGRGTRVTFRLPAQGATDATVPTAPPPPPPAPGP